MLTPKFYGSFKKDYKRAEKCNLDMRKLDAVMNLLINEESLLPRHNNHRLQGGYIGWWECHIEPDWLLVYRKSGQELVFYRTGTHSDLF